MEILYRLLLAETCIGQRLQGIFETVDEVASFLMVAVGVAGAHIESLLRSETAVELPNRFAHDIPVTDVIGHPPGSDIERYQFRIGIEHLFEVGHRPRPVDAVTEKGAVDLVVESAALHRIEGLERHLPGFFTAVHPIDIQKKPDSRTLGKFRALTPPFVAFVVIGPHPLDGSFCDFQIRQQGFSGQPFRRLNYPVDRFGTLFDPFSVVFVESPVIRDDRLQSLHAVGVDRRDVGGGEKGFSLFGQKNRQRPSPAAAV